MQCQGPGCTKTVEQKEGGHRARKYCSDACRVAAHRAAARAAEAERANNDALRIAAAKETEAARERQEIRNRYAMLSDASLDLLLSVKQHYGLHTVSEIGTALVREHETASAGQVKYQSLLADFMQAGKKIGFLERQIHKYERLEITSTRESMLQELMVLGGRLKYASLTNLGIEAGIDEWLNYARGASDSDLAAAIAHGYYQADTLAMAAIEANDLQIGVQMRARIDELERMVALQAGRIDELEQGTGEHLEEAKRLRPEQIQALVYHAREQTCLVEQHVRQIEELEDTVQARIDEILRLKESHSSTMYHMNLLLAKAQSAAQQPASASVTPHSKSAVDADKNRAEQELERLRTLTAKQELALAVRSETVIKRGVTIRAQEKTIEEQKNQLGKVTDELEHARLAIAAREANMKELTHAPHSNSAVENAALQQSLEHAAALEELARLKQLVEGQSEQIRQLETSERQVAWEAKEARAAREWAEIQARYRAAEEI